MYPISVSPIISRKIYEDGIAAYKEKNHPCHHLIQWQIDNNFAHIHMPEPFSGFHASLGIIFIGLNPSITNGEVTPCFSDNGNFEDYDLYFRTRFDNKYRDNKGCPLFFLRNGDARKAKLWSSIERFGKNYINPGFKLGEHALLTQAVPYKTTQGYLGNSQESARVILHTKKFILEILDTPGLQVVVPMGNEAWAQVQSLLSFRNNDNLGLSIMGAMGKRFKAITPKGNELFVVPIKHMSYPPSKKIQSNVGDLIVKSLAV